MIFTMALLQPFAAARLRLHRRLATYAAKGTPASPANELYAHCVLICPCSVSTCLPTAYFCS
jgi:hypothetical protein